MASQTDPGTDVDLTVFPTPPASIPCAAGPRTYTPAMIRKPDRWRRFRAGRYLPTFGLDTDLG
jgi:hypothetical protein